MEKKETNLGERLYELRCKNGLSQDDLAEKINVSRQTISNWENNKVKIDLNKAVEICELFNIKLDDLVNDNPKKEDVVVNNDSNKLVLLIGLGFVSLTIVVLGILLIIFGKNDPYSSTVIIDPKLGGSLVVIIGLVIVAVGLITFYKKKK